MPPKCAAPGCEKPAEQQCPLCVDEGEDQSAGQYCGDGCFAKDFVAHRDKFHPMKKREKKEPAKTGIDGQVIKSKTKRKVKKDAVNEKPKSKDTTEDLLAEDAAAKEMSSIFTGRRRAFGLWPRLPNLISDTSLTAGTGCWLEQSKDDAKTLAAHAKKSDVVKVNVSAAGVATLPSAALAIHLLAQLAKLGSDTAATSAVFCGNLVTAGAVAWAARCSGLKAIIRAAGATTNTVSDSNVLSIYVASTSADGLQLQKTYSTDLPEYTIVTCDVEGDVSLARKLTVQLTDTAAAKSPKLKWPLSDAASSLTWVSFGGAEDEGLSSTDIRKVIESEMGMNDTFSAEVYNKMGPMGDRLFTAVANSDVAGAISAAFYLYNNRNSTLCEAAVYAALTGDRGSCLNLEDANDATKTLLSLRLEHHKLATFLWKTVAFFEDAEPTNVLFQRKATRGFIAVVARSVLRAARHCAPLPFAGGRETISTSSPADLNTTLDAVLCFAFNHIPLNVLDGLAACWGYLDADFGNPLKPYAAAIERQKKAEKQLQKTGAAAPLHGLIAEPTVKASLWPGVVPGRLSIRDLDRERNVAIHALTMRFKNSVGTAYVYFINTLMHFLMEYCQKRVSWTVKDVDQATFWTPFLGDVYGDLGEFLSTAGLLYSGDGEGRIGGKLQRGKRVNSERLSKKQILSQAVEAARKGDAAGAKKARLLGHQQGTVEQTAFIRIDPALSKFTVMPRKKLPLSETTQRHAASMNMAAVDTVLSVMPSSKDVPMYVGDVGQHIGKWGAFNAKHGGKLGGTLMEFLELHADQFDVAGNIVRRKHSTKAGRVQIRSREEMRGFVDDDSDDDANEPSRKKSRLEKKAKVSKGNSVKRQWLADAEAKLRTAPLSTRAKKKKVQSLRNKERFNKNRKHFDQSAKVKNYVKPKNRSVAGRGTKKNLRTQKYNGE